MTATGPKRSLLLLAAALGAVVLAGCAAGPPAEAEEGGLKETEAGAAAEGGGTAEVEAPEEAAVPVETEIVGRGAIESLLRSTAHVEAESAVSVYARTTGLVRELRVEEGSHVRKGEVLLQLDDEEQRSALRKAEANLARREGDFERLERLFRQQLISEQEFNESRYQLEQDRIAVEDARRNLEYTTVRAPIKGTVSLRAVNLGQRVQTGARLLDLVDFDTLVARVYVPEKDLPRVAVGQRARISSRTAEEKLFRGSVERIAPVVDAASGTVKVTVAVGDQPGLRPGMYVDVDLVTRRETDAVLLPKRAVVYDRDEAFVYRVEADGRARKVPVEVELADKHRVKPRDGFAAGDRVVVAGQMGLKDGSPVELLDAATGAPEAPEEAEPPRRASR